MVNEKNVIYYNDEANDDFANGKIETVKIDQNYKYIRKNPIWNISAFILYRIIAMPIAFIYAKLKFKMKIVNKEKLKKCKDKGYFVYINHTQEILDTLLPTLVGFPKRAYIITHPNNVSIKGLKIANKMLGAMPLPGDLKSSKNFLDAIKNKIDKKNIVAIYPEAHVWPFYTKIRSFGKEAFRYPVKFNAPVYSFTVTYKKGKRKLPDIDIYVDGPFYPNKEIELKKSEEELRNAVYDKMVERSKKSNIEYIKYIKQNKGENND